MKLFYIFFVMVLVLQVEILAVLFLERQEVSIWNLQIEFNKGVIDVLSKQCSL